MGRAAFPPYRIDEGDDSLIRARDGYAPVMEICPGDRAPCPKCGTTLRVPHLAIREVRCPQCARDGRDAKWVMGYYPLGEVLLQHLRRIDPRRGGTKDVVAELDRRNRARLRAKEKELSTLSEDVLKDRFTELFDIHSVGFTGREAMWAGPAGV